MKILRKTFIMGSAHLFDRPDIMEEKKSIKNILSKPLKSLNRVLFSKKREKNSKDAANSNCNEANAAQKVQEKQKKVDVEELVENFYKFKIKEREKDEELNKEEDELNKFVFKVIEDDRKSERTSQSSEDSGFADKISETLEDKSDKTLDETLSKTKPQEKSQKDTTEKRDENGVEIEEALQSLKISDDGKRVKRLQTFSLARAPIRNNKAHLPSSHPYGMQINQVHKHSFCGGNVIFNEDPVEKLIAEHETKHYNNVATFDQINYVEKLSVDSFTEFDEALLHVKEHAQNEDVTTDELNSKLNDIMDFIVNDSFNSELNNDVFQSTSETCNDRSTYELSSVVQNNNDQIKNTSYEQSLSDVNNDVYLASISELNNDVFHSSNSLSNDVNQIENRILQDFAIQTTKNTQDSSYGITSFMPDEVTNPIDEFARLENGEYTNIASLERDLMPLDAPKETFPGGTTFSEGTTFPEGTTFVRNFQDYDFQGPFLTPPHSDNMMPSPSDSVSFYPSLTSVSPVHSLDLDHERFQDLSPPELPSFLNESPERSIENIQKKRERKSSSSMTMKQYKDLQKELSAQFTNKDCCDPKRSKCSDLFMEYVNKLSIEQRKDLCVAVARLELMEAYSYLHRILLILSESSDKEEWHYSLFFLICQRIMGQSDTTAQKIFVGDFGLRLLKSAALRCTHRPLLTRLLAECARKVIHDLGGQITEPIFQEIDSQGDNLIIVCVRKGDAAAQVLYELLCEPGTLFDVDHSNTEGLTALHEACRQHGAAAPSRHAVHVLLTHGRADLWKGDVTGDDTAVHLAVNSAHCDLTLVMIMFRHVDRKQWRKLAHLTNRSSKTPLEYARTAVKSTDRKNYPVEVLEFLKKCR